MMMSNTATTASEFGSFVMKTLTSYPDQYIKTTFVESDNEYRIIGSGTSIVAQFRPDGIRFAMRGEYYASALTFRSNGVVELNRDHLLQPDTRPFIGETKVWDGNREEYQFTFHFPYDLAHAMEFVERLHRLLTLEICTVRMFDHIRKNIKTDMLMTGDDLNEDYCEIIRKEPKPTAISIGNSTTGGFCLVYTSGFEDRITEIKDRELPDGIGNDHLFDHLFEGFFEEDGQFAMKFDLPREYDNMIHMLTAAMK